MSPAAPLHLSAIGLDLSPRFYRTGTVVGSPALAAETIIASVQITADIQFGVGVLLVGYAAFTVGTDGTGVTFKIRRTDASGSTRISSGILPYAAAALGAHALAVTDTGPTLPGQTYVLTMTVANASAVSTVSAVELAALVA